MMENDQIINYAKKLKTLLQSHDRAAQQISLLDMHINKVTKQIFASTLDDCHGMVLHFLTRKSVLDGIKKIFENYRQTKLQHIQKLSSFIISSLQEGHHDDDTFEVAFNMRHQSDPDELAMEATSTFCRLQRSA